MPKRGALGLLGVVIAVAALGSLFLLGWRDDGVWSDLEDAESTFGVPDGFEKLDSQRDGTTYCVISCDEARIIVAFGTDLPAEEACDALFDAASQVSDDLGAVPFEETDCFITGSMDDRPLEQRASISGSIQPAERITSLERYDPDWVRTAAERAGTERIVEVYLNSGID